ncbi:hypothetical protein SUGI_0472740 [Cryptomeria japonica]|nr:hypothetical protein SUGI_0472740 [Cryptomeria japonica]
MKKAAAVVLIVMIEVATSMPVLMAWNPLPQTPPPPAPVKCTLDALKLGACVNVLSAIRAKLLNLNILVPVALQLIAACGMTPPPNFTCPAS